MIKSVGNNKLAPDGGWGYVVCGVMALALIVDRGILHCYGMIFEELLYSVGANTTELVSILSVYSMCFCTTTLFTSSLFKHFSCRQVGLVGAFLIAAGGCLTSVATSFTLILIFFSIMHGIALGLILPTIFTAFYQYFVKKRSKVYFVSKSLVAVAAMGFPILINHLLEQYGNRGMLLLLGGIYAQLIVAMALLQPVEWHMKKGLMRDIELRSIHANAEETEDPLLDKTQVTDEEEGIQKESNKNYILTTERKKDLKKTGKINEILDIITNSLDLTLFKDLTFVYMLIGICFVESSEITFGSLIPGYLLSIGWTMKDVAFCLSTSGIGDLVARVGLAAFGLCFAIKGRYLFLISCIFGFIFKIAFLFVYGYLPITIVVTGIVFFKTSAISAITLMLADHFPIERFPAALALYFFFGGLIIFTVGPIIGAIKDYTGSYNIPFYILTICYSAGIIPWTVELIWKKIKNQSRAM